MLIKMVDDGDIEYVVGKYVVTELWDEKVESSEGAGVAFTSIADIVEDGFQDDGMVAGRESVTD